MADKQIKVKVDVETNVEPSIAALKELKKQLRETAAGSAEFQKLQQQINDTEDAIKSARTGASNFTEVLGQLPGPIGDIGNKVSGAVNSLKQFGGLKLNDLKTSFVELGKDVVDAAQGLGQLTGITKAYTILNGFLAKSFVAVGVAEQTAAVGARALSAALIATGIGALVVLLATAAAALYELATGEKEAAAAADVLNRAIETQNQLLDLNQASTNRRNKVELAQLKAQGADAQKIRETQFRQAKETYEQAYKDEQEAVRIYNANIGKADAEGLKKLTENLNKRQQATKDAYATAQEIGYNNKAEELKEEEDKNKQLTGKAKALTDARIAERKRELEALKKGLLDARLATLSAEDKELEEVRIKYDELKAQAIKYGEDTKVIEEARLKENIAITGKYAQENRDKKQKEYEDALALEEQNLNLRVAKGEITESEYQNKLFEIRKNNAVQLELLTNDNLKKEQDTLNNQRIADLANLQIALQNEESKLQTSLDNKNAILLSDLQNGVITQKQFDAKKLEVQIEYQTALDKINGDAAANKIQIEKDYQTALDTTNAKALKKEQETLNNKRLVDLSNLQIALQNEQSTLENSLDKKNAIIETDLQNEQSKLKSALDSKNAILLNDLQNGVINQEQFDTKKLEVEIEYQTNLETINTNALEKKTQVEVEYKSNLETINGEAAAKKIQIEKDYQTALDTTNTEALAKNKDFIAAQIELEKYKVDEKKKLAEDERSIVLLGLQSKIEALDAENKRIDGDFEADLQRLTLQKDILREQEAIELQNTELTEFQKTEIRKKYADARAAITDQEIVTEKAAAQAKQEINMAYLKLFEQFGNVLSQVAGKNKALAIAGVVISQAASIGQIVANTGIANAKAIAASPLTFGAPWVLINTISAGLSIASTIAGAVKSIQQINQAASQAGVKGGGGGGSVGAAPNIPTPKVAGAAAPTINVTGGQNPSTAIAQSINTAQAPIKAYVVSGEVSSQQALDRRTSRAATFVGG